MSFDRGTGATGTGEASVLAIDKGGTGADTTAEARTNLNLGALYSDSNGSVGVGTTTPSSLGKLAVVGEQAQVNLYLKNNRNSVGDSVAVQLDQDGGPILRMISSQFGIAVLDTITNSPLSFGTNALERMRIASDGNVGVGTSSPSARLDISGVTNSYALKISDGTHTAGLIPSGNNTVALYTPDTTGLSFWTNDNERMRIDPSGNVGIGTTTPARKLHISDVMRLEPRNGAPSSPSKGDIYFDSADNKLKCYDGTNWQNLF